MDKEKLDKIKANIEALKKAYPKAFSDERRPLKLGIHKEILGSKFTRTQKIELAYVMRHWCSNVVYLKNISAGGHRYDLHGNEAGEVSEENIKSATEGLHALYAKFKKKNSKKKKKEKSKSV